MGKRMFKCLTAAVLSLSMVGTLGISVTAFDPVEVVRKSVYKCIEAKAEKRVDGVNSISGYVEACVTKEGLETIEGNGEDLSAADVNLLDEYKVGVDYNLALTDSRVMFSCDTKVQDELLLNFIDVIDMEKGKQFIKIPTLTNEVGSVAIDLEDFNAMVNEGLKNGGIDVEVAQSISKRYVDVALDNLEYQSRSTEQVTVNGVTDEYTKYVYDFDFAAYYYDLLGTFKTDTEFKENLPELYESIDKEFFNDFTANLDADIVLDENGAIVDVEDYVEKWVKDNEVELTFTFAFDGDKMCGFDMVSSTVEGNASLGYMYVCDLISEGNNYGLNMYIQETYTYYPTGEVNEVYRIFDIAAKHDNLNKVSGTLSYTEKLDGNVLCNGEVLNFVINKDDLKNYTINVGVKGSNIANLVYAKQVEAITKGTTSSKLSQILSICDYDAGKVTEAIGLKVPEENKDIYELRDYLTDYLDGLDDNATRVLFTQLFAYDREHNCIYDKVSFDFMLKTIDKSMKISAFDSNATLLGYIAAGVTLDKVDNLVINDIEGEYKDYDTIMDYLDELDTSKLEEQLNNLIGIE